MEDIIKIIKNLRGTTWKSLLIISRKNELFNDLEKGKSKLNYPIITTEKRNAGVEENV